MPKGIRKTVELEYKKCPTPPIKTGALGFYKSGAKVAYPQTPQLTDRSLPARTSLSEGA